MLDIILEREAASRPTSWNASARTVDAVISSSTPVQRRDAQGPYDEILDPRGADLNNLVGASVLDAHRTDNVRCVLGVVERARVEGNEIVATLRMSDRAEVADVVNDIAQGIIRNLSVGYSVQEWSDGTNAKRRTKTATKWSPREISFVAVSADSNAKTRGMEPLKGTTMNERPSINKAIRELATRAGADLALANDLVDREVTVEEARTAVLDDVIRRGSITINSTANHQTVDNPEFFRDSVVDALTTRLNPNHKPAPAAEQYVGLSCADIARVCLQRANVNTMGMGADKLISTALMTRDFGIAPGSTSDYPSIMLNVLDKELRVAYKAAPSGLKQVSRETSNVDFRAKFKIMLDSTGIVLGSTAETGEFGISPMVDGAESYAVSTVGTIFTISRQALVNDNIDAFGDISRRLGIAAAQYEATFLATLLLSNSLQGPKMADGDYLFSVGHANYQGTGAVPSVTTLTAARLAMRHQTGMGGGLIAVEPNVLVVPAELETLGEQLITEIHPVVVGEVNPFSKLTSMVVEPRLPAYGWYLVSKPEFIDGLEHAYLARSPGPQVESRLGFVVDGIQVRVRLDFGGGFVDHRGWYYNAGQ